MFCGRETTDSYSISVSPKLGFLGRAQSYLRSCTENYNRSNLEQDTKSPLLPHNEFNGEEEDEGMVSLAAQLSFSKASFASRESPITTHGCNVTQTVFNCKAS